MQSSAQAQGDGWLQWPDVRRLYDPRYHAIVLRVLILGITPACGWWQRAESGDERVCKLLYIVCYT